MVAVTESTASFDSGMQKKRSHLFWGFMGTLETIVLILLLLIRRQLVRPIIGVAGVIGAISEKDLDLKKRLPLNRVDEIGRLAFFVNRFIDLFQGWVGEISDRVEWVLTHSELLSKSLEQEKKEDKEELVRLFEIQNRLQGVRREMGLGPDSIRPASDNLIHLMERTTILQAGIQGILNSIVDAEKLSKENARDLDLIRDGQNQLETLLTWIKDIGERTNMVALNATIQASQAGPAGLAFRVVSDSLSQLARKTQEVTGESSAKIASLQLSLKTLAHSFDAGLGHVSRAGRGLLVTQGDLERVSALMSQLGKTLTVLDERILAEVNMLAQIDRDVRALAADRKIRDSRKPLDEKRLEEILRVARELQEELRRFKI
jgi:methyl-accepting chemotaxis protein